MWTFSVTLIIITDSHLFCQKVAVLSSKPAQYGIKTQFSYTWTMQVYKGKQTGGGLKKNQGVQVGLDVTDALCYMSISWHLKNTASSSWTGRWLWLAHLETTSWSFTLHSWTAWTRWLELTAAGGWLLTGRWSSSAVSTLHVCLISRTRGGCSWSSWKKGSKPTHWKKGAPPQQKATSVMPVKAVQWAQSCSEPAVEAGKKMRCPP